VYELGSIEISNRRDGSYDDGLPLVVETSLNGAEYAELARRADSFRDWEVDGAGRRARWVRIRSERDQGYVALDEVRVFAR
jgi:hypothetical protein